MPRMALIFLLILNFSSCINHSNGPGELVFVEQSKTLLAPAINQRDFDGNINFNDDIVLINNDYPLELRIYQNKKFHYNLPNLGQGEGQWEFSKGKIHLKSKYHIKQMDFTIDMNYLIGITSEQGSLAVTFSDRFGPKVLPLKKQNLR